MKRTAIGLIAGVIVTAITTAWVSNTTLDGAQAGGGGTSKSFTWEARLRPEQARKDILPFSLLMGGVAGLIAFGITFAVIPKEKRANPDGR